MSTAEQADDPYQQLLIAAKAGAARELYEETGMDILRQLDRLDPAPLHNDPSSNPLPNLYKSRLFFFLSVTDDDFPKGGITPMGTVGKHLKLRLSVEHSGFIFQPEPSVAAEMLKHHSGGKCSEALLMAQGGGNQYPKKQSTVAETKEDPLGGKTHKGQSTGTEEDNAEPGSRGLPTDLLPPPKKESDCCCFGSSS